MTEPTVEFKITPMDTGEYIFDVQCPDCHRMVQIKGVDMLSPGPIVIDADHDCSVDASTGEVL